VAAGAQPADGTRPVRSGAPAARVSVVAGLVGVGLMPVPRGLWRWVRDRHSGVGMRALIMPPPGELFGPVSDVREVTEADRSQKPIGARTRRGRAGGDLTARTGTAATMSPPTRLDRRCRRAGGGPPPGRRMSARRIGSALGARPCCSVDSLAALRSTRALLGARTPKWSQGHRSRGPGIASAAIETQHERMPCGVHVSNSRTLNNYRMTMTAQHRAQQFIPCLIESSLYAPNVVPERLPE
jgi:hypothetical protein